MKTIIACVLFIVFASNAFGQTDIEAKVRKNEFGTHVGFTTGCGFSYRHWFNKIGFQLTALPISTETFTFISGGLTGLYTLHKSKYVRVYTYLSNHVYHYTQTDEIYDYNTSQSVTRTTTNNRYNIGVGPGFSFGRVVAFNIMLGYGLYDVTQKFNTLPTGEMGVYYNF